MCHHIHIYTHLFIVPWNPFPLIIFICIWMRCELQKRLRYQGRKYKIRKGWTQKKKNISNKKKKDESRSPGFYWTTKKNSFKYGKSHFPHNFKLHWKFSKLFFFFSYCFAMWRLLFPLKLRKIINNNRKNEKLS